MKLYYWNDSTPITPVQFDQERDFDSFLGDAALVGKAGEVGRRRPSAAEREGGREGGREGVVGWMRGRKERTERTNVHAA
jgi:hypothetical protein